MALAPVISATEAALLGLLTRGEMSGYDLQRAAESAGGLFWTPTKSRIYAVLPRLVERGHATSREIARSGRPTKQVYLLTKAGRAALQEWLEAPPALEPERAPVLLKLYFGELLEPQTLLSHLLHIRTQASALRQRLEAQPAQQDLYADLAVRHTLEWLRALSRWAAAAEREVAARLEAEPA